MKAVTRSAFGIFMGLHRHEVGVAFILLFSILTTLAYEGDKDLGYFVQA